MPQSTISADLVVTGLTVPQGGITLPNSCVTDSSVVAATGIQATKCQQQYQPMYSQPSLSGAIADQRVLYVTQGASATVVSFYGGSITAASGNAYAIVDCLVSGSTILSSGAITLQSGQISRTQYAGTVTVNPTWPAGTVFESKISVSGGTGGLPLGVFARLEIRESAQ